MNFNNVTYTYNGNAKTISADSTINWELSLLGVGKSSIQETKNADSAKSFEALNFDSKTLEFGNASKIKITFDGVIKGCKRYYFGRVLYANKCKWNKR